MRQRAAPPIDLDSKYRLSQRVRMLRKDAGLTLSQLGERTGLSTSVLSKIENGLVSVSFDKLVTLAKGLACELTALIGQESRERVTGRRSVTKRGGGDVYESDFYRYELLCADLAGRQMFPLLATLKAHSITEFGEPIRHDGEEFVHVLSGSVELHTEFYSPIRLVPGDSAYYDSTMGHALLRVGTREARVLWVCTATAIPANLLRKNSDNQKSQPGGRSNGKR